MNIGICDSNDKDRELLQQLCEEYSLKKGLPIKCMTFSTGEEFFDYCDTHYDYKFDVLFLEIELDGMNWRDIKERVIQMNTIREIIFLTNKKEYIHQTFDLKVKAFEVKPADSNKIDRLLNMVLKDSQCFTVIKLDKTQTANLGRISYFAAEGAYTRIFFYSDTESKYTSFLSSESIGSWEKQLKDLPVIRVHKSYMVNLFFIKQIDTKIKLNDLDFEVPIGRIYKDEVNKKYLDFLKKNSQ